MSLGFGDSPKETKKLKQLSITESFGSRWRKRKLSTECQFSSSKKSINTQKVKNKSFRPSHQIADAMSGDDTCKEDHQRIATSESSASVLKPDGSNELNVSAMKQIEEAAKNDAKNKSPEKEQNLIKVKEKHVRKLKSSLKFNETKIHSETTLDGKSCSQGSDDLYDIVMQEKREANNRLLKREIKEDSDISQGTPPPRPSSPVMQKKSEPDDVLNIYDSPDLFDTFPTLEPDSDFEEDNAPVAWLGKPKSRLKTAPDCLLPLPQLKESQNHTVLFDTSYYDIGPPPPRGTVYMDAWDSHHVKLPCSPKSLFPSPTGQEKELTNRWELIENALLADIENSSQLENAILHYNVSYNKSFTALHDFCGKVLDSDQQKQFFSTTLPKMINLALSLPNIITQPIPLLQRQKGHCITLSQQQIACLLANAFLCTFPRRNSTSATSEYASFPSINFNRLFIGTPSKSINNRRMEKLKTIFHYFKRVTEEMPSGVVTFERRVCKDFPVWNISPCELCEIHVSNDGLIEDEGQGMLQMDFANKYVGGGVLKGGMVQEEILFCIYPELIVSRLFTEVLDDNECLVIAGAERFSNYSGYAETYKWEGNHVDTNTRDIWRRKSCHFVALDATHFHRSTEQYRIGNIRRELNKLYCGFQGSLDPDYSPAIATGNWGCGAFKGDPVLKALLQLMAAAVVGRDLCYFTFRDEKLMKVIYDMHQFIKNADIHVGDLWNTICRYNTEEVQMSVRQKVPIVENIFEYMQRQHRDYDASTDEDSVEPL